MSDRSFHTAPFLFGGAAIIFGLATLKEGGSVLFIDGASRAEAGAFVPFVVWTNFLAGFAYLAAGFGLVRGRPWAARLALGLAAVTVLLAVAFGVHVALGGAYERRTVAALAVRAAFWIVTATVSTRGLRPALS